MPLEPIPFEALFPLVTFCFVPFGFVPFEYLVGKAAGCIIMSSLFLAMVEVSDALDATLYRMVVDLDNRGLVCAVQPVKCDGLGSR